METCRELRIETRFPDKVKEDWSGEKKESSVKEGGP